MNYCSDIAKDKFMYTFKFFMQVKDIQSLGDLAQIKDHTVIRTDVLKELLKDSRVLEALVEHGVDNWNGYSDAMKSLASED